MPTKPESGAKSLEQELDELQEIVTQLETDSLGLEESIALYEKGVALSESAKKRLDEAETRIEILSKRGNKIEPEPFGK